MRTHLELSENEIAWLHFLRLIGRGQVPPPTLEAIQALRKATSRPQRED